MKSNKGKKNHGLSHTPVYSSWESMIRRCNNPNYKRYGDYGGRGIKICEHWHDFRNFFEDMGHRPQDLTLDRKDNDGNYEPGNCRWATYHEQRINSRPKSCGPQKQRMFIAMDFQGTMIASNNQCEFARQHRLGRERISCCLRNPEHHKQTKGWMFRWIR